MSDQPKRPLPWKEVSASVSRWSKPFILVEWSTEWAVYALQRWAAVQLLQLLGSFTLLAALIAYCNGADERQHALIDQRKVRQYQAWQAISAAQGKSGNGGRIQALQDLAQDSVPLSGVDVAHAWLQGISLIRAKLDGIRAASADLARADLRFSDLRGARLDSANLVEADLRGADLARADLRLSHLRGARLDSANLLKADLRGADLQNASLRGAQLVEVCLDGANLAGADLRGAKLLAVSFQEASLAAADLRMADMNSVWFDSADLSWTDLRSSNLHNTQISSARTVSHANLSGVVLPAVPRRQVSKMSTANSEFPLDSVAWRLGREAALQALAGDFSPDTTLALYHPHHGTTPEFPCFRYGGGRW
jgi:uncharacterized protein YjbI with pentapeptide repeats